MFLDFLEVSRNFQETSRNERNERHFPKNWFWATRNIFRSFLSVWSRALPTRNVNGIWSWNLLWILIANTVESIANFPLWCYKIPLHEHYQSMIKGKRKSFLLHLLVGDFFGFTGLSLTFSVLGDLHHHVTNGFEYGWSKICDLHKLWRAWKYRLKTLIRGENYAKDLN